jgi:excisionase family DNA binding protein
VDQSGTTRVTVEEAARLLGIEKGSVKKRIQRGKLRSEKDASGTLYVDRSETVQDKSQGRSETGRDELLESKDETISILRDQLREEREARRRADTPSSRSSRRPTPA